MGLCFSKKKKPPPGATSKKVASAGTDDKVKKKTAAQPKTAAKVAVADKNAVKAKVAAEEKKNKRAPQEKAAAAKQFPVSVVPSAPIRTSSCTREEVDAILIQCGRLSRSSSGAGRTPSRDTGSEGGHRRRRSASKRSYDFDQERKAGDEEGDWESGRPVSRPSPHRGSPQRKRSGSRERSGGSGSRRASRSPGRRGAEGGGVSSAATGVERARQQQHPGKMVSVPAREKTRAPSPVSGIRCASPRSSSPARMVAAGNENACNGVPAAGPALSRSSSRKAEQSPYRRNPMAELDENTLPRNANTNTNNSGKPQKATVERVKEPTGTASARSANEPQKREAAEDAATAAAASGTRPLSAKTNATRTASAAAAEKPRSRRASRDFDKDSSNSYASQILEDIQNYHEQHQAATPSFSLPACVAKACSILDAVADLNSSSSSSSGNNRTTQHDFTSSAADDKGSVNAAPSTGTDHTTRVAAARRHVHVPAPARDVTRATEVAEPQESAGSNSVSAFPCTPSWEPASVESSDRTWSASAGDEVVDQGCAPPSPVMNRARQGRQRPEPSGGRSRAGSSAGNGNSSLHRGRTAHRGSGSVASGRSGVRTVSVAS